MEPLDSEITDSNPKEKVLFQVTPLSKYLAMILFIAMPFIGGWIGYTYAPEKIVEIMVPVLEAKDEKSSENVTVPIPPSEPSIAEVEITKNKPLFSFPSFPRIVYEEPFRVVDPDSSEGGSVLRDHDNEGSMHTYASWGDGPPRIYVKESVVSVTEDPNCEYACGPSEISKLEYFTYNYDGDLVNFFTEEMEVSHIQKADYIMIGYDLSTNRFSFIQSINAGYCCDGSGTISNRLFEVDLKNNKTIVKENLDL
jgi:hypothetical protein